MTILIVDDNPVDSIIRCQQANQANTGHDIVTVDNLEAAKKELAKGSVSAVITDNDFFKDASGKVQFDAGIDLVKHIHDTYPDVPVFWNSSHLDQLRLDKLRAATGQTTTDQTSDPLPAGAQAVDVNHKVKAGLKTNTTLGDELKKFLVNHLGQSPNLSPSTSHVPPPSSGGGKGR